MALGSVNTYKSTRGIAGTAEDTRLAALLTQAESVVRMIGGRNQTNGYEQAERTEVVSGNGARSLVMQERPIISIASITYLAPDGSTTLVDSAWYWPRAGSGLIYVANPASGPTWPSLPVYAAGYGPVNAWAKGHDNYSVVYTAGYATIPPALAEAVYLVMDWMRADNGSGPFQSESIGGEYSYSRLAADPKGPYERIRQIAEAF